MQEMLALAHKDDSLSNDFVKIEPISAGNVRKCRKIRTQLGQMLPSFCLTKTAEFELDTAYMPRSSCLFMLLR